MKNTLSYRVALICKYGHLISGDSSMLPDSSIKHCPQCGQDCISSCPSCGAPIHGDEYIRKPAYRSCRSGNIWDDSGISYSFAPADYKESWVCGCMVPAYCYSCGSPYPWTEILLNEAEQIVDLADELSLEQKETLKECFPDLLSETPKTPRASLIAAKLIHATSSLAQTALQNLLADHMTAFVLSLLGWKV